MKSRVGLGLTSIAASQFPTSRWDKLRKIALFAVVCMLLAVFFYYLTVPVQLPTAHATNPNADWKSQSQ
jgi:hypothetical protein